jgi:hypothetical protein
MTQREPSKQRTKKPRSGKQEPAPPAAPLADQDKDDVHRAPESGDKPEASSIGGDQPPREPDEV